MRLSELLDQVNGKWHQEFVRFIDSGQASEEFLEHLDRDESLQRAVEEAFAAQAQALQEFARWAKSGEEDRPEEPVPAAAAQVVGERLEAALAEAAVLPTEQRREVAGRAAAAAARRHHLEVESLVHEMESAL